MVRSAFGCDSYELKWQENFLCQLTWDILYPNKSSLAYFYFQKKVLARSKKLPIFTGEAWYYIGRILQRRGVLKSKNSLDAIKAWKKALMLGTSKKAEVSFWLGKNFFSSQKISASASKYLQYAHKGNEI